MFTALNDPLSHCIHLFLSLQATAMKNLKMFLRKISSQIGVTDLSKDNWEASEFLVLLIFTAIGASK